MAPISALSTQILGRWITCLPCGSKTPGLIWHLKALRGGLHLKEGCPTLSCPSSICVSQQGLDHWKKERHLFIALLNQSQLGQDVFDRKTIAIAKQYNSSTKKTNAPVKSRCILGYLKHALISAHARKNFS